MQLQKSLWEKFHNKIVGIILFATLGGIFAILNISSYSAQSLTATGRSVSISRNSDIIRYGRNPESTYSTWSTYWYEAAGNDAVCIEPSLHSPSETGVTSTDQNKTLKRILLATVPSYSSSGTRYYNLFKNYYDWGDAAANINNLRYKNQSSIGNAPYYYCDYYYNYNWQGTNCGGKGLSDSVIAASDYIFAMGHMLAGYYYSDDTYGLDSSDLYQLRSTMSAINNWFDANYPNATDDFVLYKATPSDYTQTVAWLEYNPVEYGYARAYKYSSYDNSALSGATFSYRILDSAGTQTGSGTLTTGSNGYTSTVKAAVGGKVCFTETSPPTNFDLNSTQYCSPTITTSYTSSSPVAVQVPNNPSISGGVTIKKVDASTNTVTNGEATNVGAVFGVWKSSNYTAGATTGYETTITIGSDGTGSTSCTALPQGSYVVQEITPGTGYVVDRSTTKTFTVNSSNNRTCTNLTSNPFKNTVITGSARILKKRRIADGATTNFSGVSFQLYYSDGTLVDTQTTGSDGTAMFSNLKYGSYTLKEVAGTVNNAYSIVSNKTFSVASNATNIAYYSSPIVNELRDNPDVSTVARNSRYTSRTQSGASELEITTSASVTDLITYSGLTAGLYYKFNGTIYDITNNSSAGTGTKTFTPGSTGSGTTEVVFNGINTSRRHGHTLSIIQELYVCNGATDANCTGGEWIRIFRHNGSHNIAEEQVTVKTVSIATTATAKSGSAGTHGNKYVLVGPVTITDTVTMSGLIAGESYRLDATLVNQSGGTIATATKTFSATGSALTTESQSLDLSFDSVNYLGQTVTVYERIYRVEDNVLLATHEVLGEAAQTITVDTPTLATVAKAADGTKLVEVDTPISVNDTVTYTNLVPGTEYTIRAYIYSIESSGLVQLGSNTSANFTADASGKTTVTISNIDTTAYFGKTLVIYDYLYKGNVKLAEHTVQTDTDQQLTVKTPSISTRATAKNSSDERKLGVGHATLVDTVTYQNLVPGKTYTITGTLMNTNGTILNVNGSTFITTAEFTPTAATGSVALEFNIDTTYLFDINLSSQPKIVVFEKLYKRDSSNQQINIASHEDITDTEQTIQVATPSVHTTAVNKLDGSKMLGIGEVTVLDTIHYEGLVGGDYYQVRGILIDATTGEQLSINDEEIENTKRFKAAANGEGDVTIEINLYAYTIQGRRLIAYEYLFSDPNNYSPNELLGKHEDINDPEQTVTVKVAKVETTATDQTGEHPDGDHMLEIGPSQKILDTVVYDGLMFEEDYIMVGKLMDATDPEHPVELNINGETFTIETPFSTGRRTDNGTLEMNFEIDTSNIPGKRIVVFEYIYKEDSNGERILVTSHTDVNDADQTVKVSLRVGTNAADDYDGDSNLGVGEATIIDKVKYEGTTVGQTYQIYGILMDKETGNPILIDGEKIEQTVNFKIGDPGTEESTGTVDMLFDIDTTELIGKKIVVFEELRLVKPDNTTELEAEHKDINDENQTVTVSTPEVYTTAADAADNDKELAVDSMTDISDIVRYKNLVKDTSYVIEGILMNKETGEELKINGKIFTATFEFVATDSEGQVELIFQDIETNGLAGKEIVVFEKLYKANQIETQQEVEDDEGNITLVDVTIFEKQAEIGNHEDLHDGGQTVHVGALPPKTGLAREIINGIVKNNVILIAIAALIAGRVAVLVYKNLHHQKFGWKR